MALEKGYNGSNGGGFETAPDGMYLCTLESIEQKVQPKFSDPEEEEIRWMWRYTAIEETDSKGKQFSFLDWTGKNYGNDKAGLTLRLDSMLGYRMTEEDWDEFDPEDSLVGKTWRVMVSEVTKADGKVVNKVIKVSPVNAARVTEKAPVKAPVKTAKWKVDPRADSRGRMPGDPEYDPYEDQ